MDETLLRLLLALALGTVLGFERFTVGKPAGFRTMGLICIGAAVFMIMADQWSDANPMYDPTRVVQGVVAGIGFLGGGVIVHRRGSVKGMTTAATIWVAASVGVACGIGSYGLALWTTGLSLLVLQVFAWIEDRIKSAGVVPDTDEDEDEDGGKDEDKDEDEGKPMRNADS